VIAKYRETFGPWSLTVMHQEDIARASGVLTSSVAPEPVSRHSTVVMGFDSGPVSAQLGGMFAASQRVGQRFYSVRETEGRGYLDSGYALLDDEIQWVDTLAAKAKLVVDGGPVRWYGQGTVRGLVADGGYDSTITLTGWSLKESGRGNQVGGLTGLVFAVGPFQIAPHALYQKPFVGPMPQIRDVYSPVTGIYYPGVSARNVVDDPFAVLDNRETIAGELLLAYDPTPATWFFHWDRMNREDAPFAASLDAVFRHLPTSRDGRLGFLADGTQFGFPSAPPAHDEWEVTGTWFANPSPAVRLSGTLFAGNGEAWGSDTRLVRHYGASLRFAWQQFLLTQQLRLHGWGPYDYHRDFNLTYPVQWYGDASLGLSPAAFGKLATRWGIRGQLRTLDRYSEGHVPSASGRGRGAEYEVGTYIHMSL
jgi:hypothetical protein